jgi:protease-4
MLQFLKNIFAPIGAILQFIQTYFKSLLFLLLLFMIFTVTQKEAMVDANLMKIHLSGPIMESAGVLAKIEEAQEDEAIKGVLFVVNSPGGAVPPSIEIAEAIKRLKQHKPVVAYAAGTMASGSYYASIYADEILANRGAMIGSIGVIMQGYNLEEVMQKVGVKEQTISKGIYKQVGTMMREWNAQEKAELDRLIGDTYTMFVGDVAKARGLDINQSSDFADAHIFTAKRAMRVGLIDGLSTLYDAQKRVEAITKVSKPVWRSESRMDKLFSKVLRESVSEVYTIFSGLKAY